MRTSGLYDVLMQDPDTAVVLSDFMRQQEFNAEMLIRTPWTLMHVNGSPSLVLRKVSE
jgi:hypothetical protein